MLVFAVRTSFVDKLDCAFCVRHCVFEYMVMVVDFIFTDRSFLENVGHNTVQKISEISEDLEPQLHITVHI